MGQLSAVYKCRDKGGKSAMSVVFIIHYFVDNNGVSK